MDLFPELIFLVENKGECKGPERRITVASCRPSEGKRESYIALNGKGTKESRKGK
jgi:hypothetical protein